jgi:hypothetical protein
LLSCLRKLEPKRKRGHPTAALHLGSSEFAFSDPATRKPALHTTIGGSIRAKKAHTKVPQVDITNSEDFFSTVVNFQLKNVKNLALFHC